MTPEAGHDSDSNSIAMIPFLTDSEMEEGNDKERKRDSGKKDTKKKTKRKNKKWLELIRN